MSALLFTIGAVIAEAIGEELGGGLWTVAASSGNRCAGSGHRNRAALEHLAPVAGSCAGGLSLFDWTDFAQTYLRLTSTAVLHAWLYNSTRGSLLGFGCIWALRWS
jgi:hypothetical protein